MVRELHESTTPFEKTKCKQIQLIFPALCKLWASRACEVDVQEQVEVRVAQVPVQLAAVHEQLEYPVPSTAQTRPGLVQLQAMPTNSQSIKPN